MIRHEHSIRCILAIALCCGAPQAGAQDQEPKKENEIRYTIQFETTPPERPRCKASLDFTYQQKNTVAHVESTLTNPDCGASSGEYVLVARLRDDDGETQSLEFPMTWAREGDSEIISSEDLEIGENVDLVSVRARRMRCLCEPVAELPAEQQE